jgi:hypothetical protein
LLTAIKCSLFSSLLHGENMFVENVLFPSQKLCCNFFVLTIYKYIEFLDIKALSFMNRTAVLKISRFDFVYVGPTIHIFEPLIVFTKHWKWSHKGMLQCYTLWFPTAWNKTMPTFQIVRHDRQFQHIVLLEAWSEVWWKVLNKTQIFFPIGYVTN